VLSELVSQAFEPSSVKREAPLFQLFARDLLTDLNVKALDVKDLLRIVELWDPIKQRTAISSLIYYTRHVEKNSSLADRVETYLDSLES